MILTYNAVSSDDGILLNNILKEKLELSQRRISRLKREDGIKVDGETAWTNRIIKSGDLIEVFINESINEHIIPQNIPIEIVYEDDYFCVVNKNSNMPIHPAGGHRINTLANALIYYWLQNKQGTSVSFHPVSRLDKDTSGLALIAKNGHIHHLMQNEIYRRRIDRKYIALLYGVVEQDEGTISAPIMRVSNDDIIRSVNFENGKIAITHFKVLQRFERYTLAEFKLETGRTHQIRVHTQYIGHPIVGDNLYQYNNIVSREENDLIKEYFNGQALHAYKLKFSHPIYNKDISLTTDLPDNMLKFIFHIK